MKKDLNHRNDDSGLGVFYVFLAVLIYGLHSKVVKFDHFKIRVMDNLPCTKKLYRSAISYPVLDNISGT